MEVSKYFQSDVVYEQFVQIGTYLRYDSFTKAIVSQLEENVHYILPKNQIKQENKGGRGQKTIIQITQEGIDLLKRNTSRRQKRLVNSQNYIYIIHCDNLPFIKCGQTTKLESRINSYNTSHWNVVVKRTYLIPKKFKLDNIEQQIFQFLIDNGCEQKSEKFKLQDIQQLDILLSLLDKFTYQFQ